MVGGQINHQSLLNRYRKPLRKLDFVLRLRLQINYNLTLRLLLWFESRGGGLLDIVIDRSHLLSLCSICYWLLFLVTFLLHVALDPFSFAGGYFHHILLVGLNMRQRKLLLNHKLLFVICRVQTHLISI